MRVVNEGGAGTPNILLTTQGYRPFLDQRIPTPFATALRLDPESEGFKDDKNHPDSDPTIETDF